MRRSDFITRALVSVAVGVGFLGLNADRVVAEAMTEKPIMVWDSSHRYLMNVIYRREWRIVGLI